MTTPVDKVFTPGPGNVFVFGSNQAGQHGAGAAWTAYKEYGAVMGQGFGHYGDSFAIPTKDFHIRTLTIDQIRSYVDRFLEYARKHPELNFFVTRIGCGLAGYTDADIGPLFKGAPANCELPYGWGQ